MREFRVYRNLHKKIEFSLQEKFKEGYRVIDYVDNVILKNVTFQVSLSSRERCLKENKRNVHAFIKTCEVRFNPQISSNNLKEITYNPYKSSNFYLRNFPGELIPEDSDILLFSGKAYLIE